MCQGITLYMQPAQDLTIDSTGEPHPVPVRPVRPPMPSRLSTPWVPQADGPPATIPLPETRDVASDLQAKGLSPIFIKIDRDSGALRHHRRQPSTTLLYDAFGQRIVSTDLHHSRTSIA